MCVCGFIIEISSAILFRHSEVVARYHGKGQINRIPHTWNPELVPVELLVYSPVTVQDRLEISFSILWLNQANDDELSYMIDYTKLIVS